MTKKATKISKNSLSMVELISEDEVKSEMGEAFASFMLNPAVSWAKFVLTDDRTNGNGERIPKDEFANLVSTGVHMPVKMAIGEISPGHPGTKPLGTMTHLKETILEDGTSAIVALAALWSKERPADVEFIKQRIAEQQPVDVSWEILYTDAVFNAEFNSMDLMGTVLSAATIVSNPAYEGRTPFLSIAAKKLSEATADTTNPDKLAEDELKTIEELQAELDKVQRERDELKTQLDTSKASITEKDAEVARLTEENTSKETELATLREYKEGIEAEAAKKEKLAQIRTKFNEANIEKDDKYFVENEETLLAMPEAQLSFMLQEMAAFAEASKTSTASKKTTKIPALSDKDTEDRSPKALGKALRENGKN